MKYLILILILSTSLGAEEYILKGRFNKLIIDPSTLQLDLHESDGSITPISSPLKRESFSILESSNNSLAWKQKLSGATYNVTLKGSRITLTISNPKESLIVWPTIEFDNSIKGLLWPYKEGLWIPYRDGFLKGISLPECDFNYFGVTHKNKTATYIQDSRLKPGEFTNRSKKLDFLSNNRNISITIYTSLSKSPIESGKVYRKHIKLSPNKAVNNYLGAPVFLLEGKEYITGADIIKHKFNDFCKTIVNESSNTSSPSFKIKKILAGTQGWVIIKNGAKGNSPNKLILEELGTFIERVLLSKEFYRDSIEENSAYLYNSFSEYLKHYSSWGTGESLGVINKIKNAGLDSSIILTSTPMSESIKNYSRSQGFYPEINHLVKSVELSSNYHDFNGFKVPLLTTLLRENYIVASESDLSRESIIDQVLFMQTPLYIVNKNWSLEDKVVELYNKFSKLHLKYGSSKLVDFSLISPSGLIQKATYEGGLTVVANKSRLDIGYNSETIPPMSLLVITPEETFIY